MLFVDDKFYKKMFNKLFNANFLKSFDVFHRDHNYLVGIILPYLWSCHCFGYGVGTFVKDNPFGHIKNINCNDLGHYKNLFVKCIGRCDVSLLYKQKMWF
jgi:hypothetical protein